jgi:cytochrome c-type biogenesis protein CcmH
MKRSLCLSLGLMIVLTGFFTSRPVYAQQPTPSEDQVNALARQLYCPVCENTPLDVCPTRACAQWRDLIREKIEQGWSDDQIKQYFAEQYGEQVLSVPAVNGPNRMIFIVPVFLFLAGGFIALHYIRDLRRRTLITGTSNPEKLPDDDPYLARVEEELANHRKR